MDIDLKNASAVLLLIILFIGIILTSTYLNSKAENEIKTQMIANGAHPIDVGCAFINAKNHDFCMEYLKGKTDGR